jgi:hypothetical protein
MPLGPTRRDGPSGSTSTHRTAGVMFDKIPRSAPLTHRAARREVGLKSPLAARARMMGAMTHIFLACSIVFSLSMAGCGKDDCASDQCVCTSSCAHACDPGGPPCHIQCATGQSCDVTCAAGEECHVQGVTSSSVTVDCLGATECHVTCPASNCTVTNCTGTECQVTCGFGSVATRSGSTATCP